MSAIDDLTGELARLPGIRAQNGAPVSAPHLLKQPAEQTRRLADALVTLSDRVRPCARCFNLTEEELCVICRDPRRDAGIICVVEEASDIGAIERAGEFRGQYHVLGGRLSPLDGVTPDDLAIHATCTARWKAAGFARSSPLATNLSLEGDRATALYVQRQLSSLPVSITRIARGLPVGGDLEYADGGTIAQALSARRAM